MFQHASLTPNDIVNHLKSHFNLIDVVRMTQYGYRLPDLYSRLKTIKKDRYEHNDRIVFIMDDVNFYIGNQLSPTAHNLQQFLYKLDIPNYFCIIVTEQPYVSQEMTHVRKLYGKEVCDIDVLDVYIDSYLKINDIAPLALNLDRIERSYIMLSRVQRKHRVLLFSMLQHDNLLDRGLVSFRIGPNPHELSYQRSDFRLNAHQIDPDIPFVSVWPWTCANENWVISDDGQETLYNDFLTTSDTVFEFKNFTEPKVNNYYVHNEVVQRAFLYVGIETVFQYPGASLTEKSFKGISNKRPFVIVGAPGNLRKLREYGFKTFSPWWSEEYDDIQDQSQRMQAIFDIIKNISQKSQTELIELGNAMESVLQYNYDFLVKHFAATQLSKLDQQCLKNLKPRYDTI
jgi:hypothetical protein